MQQLTQCIFVWDSTDVRALKEAKMAELQSINAYFSERSLTDAITKYELALHCRRTTRGVEETTRLLRELLSAFDGVRGHDTLGVPLLDTRRMQEIWEQQRRHIACLQDPPGVQLYIQTGTTKKGGMVLPNYRCGRGSTSLESFHLHMNRFIPGKMSNFVFLMSLF